MRTKSQMRPPSTLANRDKFWHDAHTIIKTELIIMDMKTLTESTRAIVARMPTFSLSCATVLGSGWSGVVANLPIRFEMGYEDIPCLGSTTVVGHAGKLVVADVNGSQVLIFLGRRHWYEGRGWDPIAFPIHLCLGLGISAVLLTNAAGGIRQDLQPGDLMAIDDHINAMGGNPLVGEHDDAWGVRFPDLSRVYDAALTERLVECGRHQGVTLKQGVYLAASGPIYETPAEVRAYAGMGADAVGMSTVPEAILAHAAGMRVAGLSCITNRAAAADGTSLSHDEVVAVTEKVRPKMEQILIDFLGTLHGLL